MRILFTLTLVMVAGCRGPAVPEVVDASWPPTAPVSSAVPTSWPHSLDAPAATGEHGMVVTDAPLATEVGIEVLREGGSAVDAAVAVAFALAVVWPGAGNIGGGGFIVLHVDGRTASLDFREEAPAAAHRDMFLNAQGEPTDKSETGHLAAGVPGSVAGLWELHQKFGTKPWTDLLEPAIALAEQGFLIESDVSADVAMDAGRLAQFPGSASLFLPGGKPLVAGTRWANPDLARTLALIARNGRDGFYKAATADLLVQEMRQGAGIVTLADLANYEPKWREPIIFTYRGYRIACMPPPSSGGVTLAMIAQQLEQYDLRKLGWHSPSSIHLQAEAMRRAYSIRNNLLGDPDFVGMDLGTLCSKDFARQLEESISPDSATPSAQVSGGTGSQTGGKHTTHFSIVDRFGNAVALTTTLNSGFGSAVTVRGAGFILNNEMDDFTSKPGTPNQFGLVQSTANAIAPHKRMLSSMAPTIIFGKNGKPVLITGASGGSYITTTVFQLLSAAIDYGLDVGVAMSAPRMHHQHLPDELALEKDGFDRSTIQALERLGHRLTFFEVPTAGWTIAATIDWRKGCWHGMADPRIHGSSRGY